MNRDREGAVLQTHLLTGMILLNPSHSPLKFEFTHDFENLYSVIKLQIDYLKLAGFLKAKSVQLV